ncbi:MAG: CHASE2 domain-containing protein [Synergistaceae bacterium]|nr:CHASE2 domain-containing protein [Synergistaceae bacterium]
MASQKIIAGGAAVLAVLLLYAASPMGLERLEFMFYDRMIARQTAWQASSTPVIVAIDDYSLRAVGQWPWPRYLWADIINELRRGGAAVIVLDTLISERDSSSPRLITNYMKLHKDIDVKFEGLPRELWDYDALLAAAVRDAPVVLAAFADNESDAYVPESAKVRVAERVSSDPHFARKLYNTESAVFPLPMLRITAPLGVMNVERDMDGILRKIPLVTAVSGKIYPTLSLRALMSMLGTEELTLGVGPRGLEYVQVKSYTIPTEPDGMMRIPFIGPKRTYEYVSAVNVLRGNVPSGFLTGRVVFIGSSAPALLNLHSTPLDTDYPAIEAHATAFDAMLRGNSITRPVNASLIQAAAIIAIGVISTLMFGFVRPVVYLPAGVALIAAAIIASRALFATGTYISPVYMVTAVIVLAIVILLVRSKEEEAQILRMTVSLAEEKARQAKEQAELDTARRIQENSLPHNFPPFENFSSIEAYASMTPAMNVGGDFYDCFPVGPGRLAVVMGDVSGKGIPAAMFMMAAKTVIKNQALLGGSPHGILTAANELLCQDNDAGMFVTAFIGIYDSGKKVLEYANAGHNPPLLMRDGVFLPVKESIALGAVEDIEYETETIPLGEGDTVVFYTDGVTEMMNKRRELFGEGRLVKLLREISERVESGGVGARSVVEEISKEVLIFAGDAAPSDDVTILALRRLR